MALISIEGFCIKRLIISKSPFKTAKCKAVRWRKVIKNSIEIHDYNSIQILTISNFFIKKKFKSKLNEKELKIIDRSFILISGLVNRSWIISLFFFSTAIYNAVLLNIWTNFIQNNYYKLDKKKIVLFVTSSKNIIFFEISLKKIVCLNYLINAFNSICNIKFKWH